jgi:hypothetical protein
MIAPFAAAVMNTVAIGSISTNICWKTISLTCSKSTDLLNHLTNTSNPSFDEFQSKLIETDLKIRINKITQLLLEFNDIETSGHTFNNSIKMSIRDVDDCIQQINKILDKAKEMMDYHSSLYFNTWNWRRMDCSDLIKTLHTYSNILRSRFDDLRSVVAIVNSFNQNLSRTPFVPNFHNQLAITNLR